MYVCLKGNKRSIHLFIYLYKQVVVHYEVSARQLKIFLPLNNIEQKLLKKQKNKIQLGVKVITKL